MTSSEERAKNLAALLDYYEENTDKPRTYWFLLSRGEQKDWIRKYEAGLDVAPSTDDPYVTEGQFGYSYTQPNQTTLPDSGEREVKANGFTREPEGSRPDYLPLLLARGIEIVPRELIERIAEHYYQGGLKYSPDNWRRGTDPESLERNRRSAARHFVAWLKGETDEDHLAAVAWNMITYEINRAAGHESPEVLEMPKACPECGSGIKRQFSCARPCGWGERS